METNLKIGDIVNLKGQQNVILTIIKISGEIVSATYFIENKGFCILEAYNDAFEKVSQ